MRYHYERKSTKFTKIKKNNKNFNKNTKKYDFFVFFMCFSLKNVKIIQNNNFIINQKDAIKHIKTFILQYHNTWLLNTYIREIE